MDTDKSWFREKLNERINAPDPITTGNIDALVVTNKEELTIYTDKTSDKIYRIFIEKMHEGAVLLNEDKMILYCNSHFANMVNLPLQTLMGKKFNNFLDPPSTLQFESLFEQKTEQVISNEFYLLTPEGNTLPVLMSFNTVAMDDQLAVSIIITDVSIQNKNQEQIRQRTGELEQTNRELENANKDLNAFTQVSSHDLQEPLRKIQNFVDLLLAEEQNKMSDNGKILFGKISHTARQMQLLINDLLEYSRTRSNEGKFEKIAMNAIVEEIRKDFEEIIREKKVTLSVGNLCTVNIIPFQFRQLVNNLISNSLKFSKPLVPLNIQINSRIVHRLKLKNSSLPSATDYCHIIYADNGIGFDPQYNERIFEVFQRLHSKQEYTGTGIGLAICKRVVENHNGIILASGKLNLGARFDIYVPV